MSLNDKYIINGSTLSAIGDALRSVYGETYQVNETVVVYQKSMGVSSFDTSSTETFNFNRIFGYSGIGFDNYGIEDTGYVRLSPSSGSYTVNATPVKENVYAFPFTVTVNGRGASARIYCYPVDENLDYIVYDQTIHKHDAYGYSYHRDITVTKPNTFLVQDIPSLISVPIDYQGLIYGYITTGSTPGFWQDIRKVCWATFIPLTSGQKVGFCIGETVSNKLRAAFFQGKKYSDFQQYVTQPASSQTQIYTGNDNITGTTELSGDGLLKRFYYTAPSDGELIVVTSFNSTSAPLHIWRA